jgi:hypothetical protein
VTADGQSWRRYSPPGARLTIELPQPPKLDKSNDEPPPPSLFPHTTGGLAYSVDLISGGIPELLFGVSNLSKRFSNRRFDKYINSLVLIIGGDNKHFYKKADVTIAGLHGRDFTYEQGEMSGRALFLNGANRIYVLIYRPEEGVTSDVVNRIFRSFRPRRR